MNNIGRTARAEYNLVSSFKASVKKNKRVEIVDEPTGLPEPPTDAHLPIEDYSSVPHHRDEDDETLVRQLVDKPAYDKDREFPGIAKQKIQRKDKHMKALDDYAKLLDKISESLEQELLATSRIMRERLEAVDAEREVKHANYLNDDFLIVRSEDELIDELGDLKALIQRRSLIIENFANELDGLESKRAETLTKELKLLVDKLIAIAHQLRDEIEHIVEGETADLNAVLIVNRKSHADLLGLLRRQHVEMEVESLQRWEDARLHWRRIRQAKALRDYRTEVDGPTYIDPADRNEYLAHVRQGQDDRHKERYALLHELGLLNAVTITADKITAIQTSFGTITERELQAVQDCYNGLCALRELFRIKMDTRVEELRKELHVYGAEEREPDLKSIVANMKQGLADESLATLWRQGGGLKADFTSLVADISSDNVAYEYHVAGIKEKLEVICSGFGLKEVLHKRGRMAQLEKVRGLIIKMRTVSRNDSKGVIQSVMPELEDILEVEAIPAIFKGVVSSCLAEMKSELDRLDLPVQASTAVSTAGHSTLSTASPKVGTRQGTGIGTAASTVGFVDDLGKTSDSHKPGTSATLTSRTSTTHSKTKKKEDDKTKCIDPLAMKQWNRKLGIIYFASDIPIEYQSACSLGVKYMETQRKCNNLVDRLVTQHCNQVVARFDKNYKLLIDKIATFLENQTSFLNNAANQLCDYFLKLAQREEFHRKEQKQLIEKSADEMWDLSEDFRIEREDREIVFENACQKIRESIEQEELQGHFENVLQILGTIQDSYRTYHAAACFKSDKFPLTLVNEFYNQLNFVANYMEMNPNSDHDVLTTFDRIYDDTFRLNKSFFEVDPNAAGVMPRPDRAVSTRKSRTPTPAIADSGPSSAVPSRMPSGDASKPAPTSVSTAKVVRLSSGNRATPIVVEESEQEPDVIRYFSPNYNSSNNTDGAVAATGDEAAALSGGFVVNVLPKELVLRFYQEKLDPEELAAAAEAEKNRLEEEAGTAASGAAPAPAATPAPATTPASAPAKPAVKGAKPEDIPAVVESVPPRQPDYRYLALSGDIVPVDPEIVKEWDEESIRQYRSKLMEAFVELTNEEMTQLEESSQGVEVYQRVKTLIQEEITERDLLADTEFVRTHPPLNLVTRMPWVLYVELKAGDLEKLVCGIRDSLLESLEKEAFKTLKLAEELTIQRKDSLTEELEDRLRTHWPRRGRVETQVKQPREAEILGHKEKTWRHIQNIASRMNELQRRFFGEQDEATRKCENYVHEINHLRDSLHGEFRSLAVLQAIDARARGTTIKFQADCTGILASFAKLCGDEINSVVFFAKDFRKVCPPQQPGVHGGYSEAEINEIEQLVIAQCAEISDIAIDWQNQVHQLTERQATSLNSQEEFSKLYDKVAQELAMSEGLGQTYGAPRRRAQERIRTEVSRDEQSAGKVDELLAKIDFYCAEARLTQKVPGNTKDDEDEEEPATDAASSSNIVDNVKEGDDNGREIVIGVNEVWDLMKRVRVALLDRATFLRVIERSPGCAELQWMPEIRIPETKTVETDETAIEGASGNTSQLTPQVTRTIFDVFDEVDATCRKETRDLYTEEGKIHILKDVSVPESLETWLRESKEKLLGRNSYRERAWKRLWAQAERLEVIVSRKESIGSNTVNDDEDREEDDNNMNSDVIFDSTLGKKIARSYQLGAPGICLNNIVKGFMKYLETDIEAQEKQFLAVVKVWELGREKHERFLRPRLSSPDAAEELANLDALEKKRSEEMTENIIKFRGQLIRKLVEHAMGCVSDVVECNKGLLGMMDTLLRQELIQVPPNTQVPHKRLTLKRLRKAQRLRQEVAGGVGDHSIERTWPSLSLDAMVSAIQAAEDLVPDLAAAAAAAVAVAVAPVDPKAKKAPPPKKGAAPPPVEEAPALLSKRWVETMLTSSAVKAQVSSAHRAYLIERDASMKKFCDVLANVLELIREKYGLLLKQEASWKQRWDRQVLMLKRGTV